MLLATLPAIGHAAEPAAEKAGQPAPARPVEKFELRDGDRVVLLGSTFIEREQKYGYFEAGLLSHFPGRKITVRNLGWSGDTVWGEARAGFGQPADGFKQLVAQVTALEPTVILVAYGANESFAGPAGLDHFRAGLATLLDALAASGPRLVLLGPLRHENLGPPLPDPESHNKDLDLYSKAIAQVAAERSLRFVNLFDGILFNEFSPPSIRLTDNGIHLTAAGYWRATPKILAALDLPDAPWLVELDGQQGKVVKTVGTEVVEISRSERGLRFRLRDLTVPQARPPAETSEVVRIKREGFRTVRVTGLAGSWTLLADGKEIDTFPGDDWQVGIVGIDGPEVDQAERLRRQIVAKNELFFHRWRPQNETYLFGFRKHEQGNNAVEIPQFDPLVASKDTRIQELTVPVEHQYELIQK
ncbi:MAG TPA: SGNH/GDSL hydrolase family protein [Pirellulales bacterium]|nr:SGNH/GDSL hydrolase family protein [Pirellulales bacterium]